VLLTRVNAQSSLKPRKPRGKSRNVISRLTGYVPINQLPIGETLARKLIDEGILLSIVVGSPGSRRGSRLVSLESWEAYTKSLAKDQQKPGKAAKVCGVNELTPSEYETAQGRRLSTGSSACNPR
jgi:hypothetical protein